MAVSFDYSNALAFIEKSEVEYLGEFVKVAHGFLHEKEGPGSDFLGWVDLPLNYNHDEFGRIRQAAERIQQQSDALRCDWHRRFLFRSKIGYRSFVP